MRPSLKEQFGSRLRSLRKAKGMTQEKLSEQTGLTIESISNIERGIFAPRFDNLEKLAAALDVEVKALFEFPQPAGRSSR